MLQHYKETFKISENGKGKKVLLIGGTHGNEYTPVYSLILFKINHLPQLIENAKKFNLDQISEITILNGINLYGLRDNTREIADTKTGNNTKDLNRSFVFDTYEETFDPRNELLAEIEKHDIIIDVHSSPALVNHCMLIDYGPHAYPYIQWCKDSKFHYAVRHSDERTIKRYAIEKGKIGVTLELNGINFIDHHSAALGARNIEDLMLNFREDVFTKKYVGMLKTFVELQSSESGIIVFPNIIDLSGKILCNLTATQTSFQGSGHLLYIKDTSSYIKKGEVAFAMQPEINIEVLGAPKPEVEEKPDADPKA